MDASSVNLNLTPEQMAYNSSGVAFRTVIALIILNTVVLILRVFMRIHRKTGFGFDDLFIFFGYLASWVLVAVCILDYLHGAGGKYILVSVLDNPDRLRVTLFALFLGQLFYPIAVTLVKFGVMIMYRRIFPTPFVKRGVIILGTLSGMWLLASILLCLLECRPMKKMWDIYGTVDGTCLPTNTLSLVKIIMIIPNIVLNMLTLGLPLYEIYHLHIGRSQKIALGGVFALGAGSIICSLMQMKYMLDMWRGKSEVTITIVPVAILAMAEGCVDSICASLPVVKPLWTSIWRLTSSSFSSLIGSRLGKSSSSPNVSLGGSTAKGSPTASRDGKPAKEEGHSWYVMSSTATRTQTPMSAIGVETVYGLDDALESQSTEVKEEHTRGYIGGYV